MGVYIDCTACNATRPTNMERGEWARTVVILDPSPAKRAWSILTVKCLRHGKVLIQMEIPMQCPIAAPAAAPGAPQLPPGIILLDPIPPTKP